MKFWEKKLNVYHICEDVITESFSIIYGKVSKKKINSNIFSYKLNKFSKFNKICTKKIMLTNILSYEFRKTFSEIKVIVTGHTGFKGSWLTLAYRNCANVLGISKDIPTIPSHYKLLGLGKKIKSKKLIYKI